MAPFITRRTVVTGGLALPLLAVAPFSLRAAEDVSLGVPLPFDFEGLIGRTKALAGKAFKPVPVRAATLLELIDYDLTWQVKFRSERALWREGTGPYPVEFFQVRRHCKEPVAIHLVKDGFARKIEYAPDYFTMPDHHVAHALPADIGFAGFRVMVPGKDVDWLSFLGASYFRCAGPSGQFGLSARGLAIDTALDRTEEFPRFTEFWLEEDARDPATIVVYALLDGPSIAGAYRFRTRRTVGAMMDVSARLFARADIERMGVAPLTSMFWYAEYGKDGAVDWRPEIHDSDGLAIATSAGERIWRPLNNPSVIRTNNFLDRAPKGFGLMQRDRDFRSYQDDGIFYERRPSAWVEPLGDWGEGAVQLVELPTDDETNDNIVAYWVPKAPVKAGSAWSFDYRLHWLADGPYPADGRVVATRVGRGGEPGKPRPTDTSKFVIDFAGGALEGVGKNSAVEAIVTASRGKIAEVAAIQIVGTHKWRAFFDIEASGAEPVDLRCYLRLGPHALTETWLFQYVPSEAGSIRS